MAKHSVKARGMHCSSCETLIKRAVEKIDGVKSVKADYATETVEIEFDSSKTTQKEISDVIEEKGYDCSFGVSKGDSENYTFNSKFFGLAFGIIGLLVIGYFVFRFVDGIGIPEISQNMGYGLLFIVGLLTGVHCVSMCGGFVVSYTAKAAKENKKSYKSHLMYGLGKTMSYTIIGAAFGLLGSIIVFTPFMRGFAGILAGLFLVIFGLNMLNIFPWLRNIRIRTPKFVSRFVGSETKKQNSPLIIGLLNGLMIACGPLQAIYIMAAGTGSALEGAKLLFVFALGTLPVMLGFGFFTSLISKKAIHKILKVSGAIVIVLGLIMINRGLALTGSGFDITSMAATVSSSSLPFFSSTDENKITGETISIVDGYQTINMEVTRQGWEPNKFVLKKNVPVRWIIDGKEITSCNNAIQVPKLGLKFDIKPGKQVIEFTPENEGVISWSCWMGMIPGTFIVEEDIDLSDSQAVQKELITAPQQKQSSCGGSCGSPTCGATNGGGCSCGGR
ncbi:MAG: sulfite exporter TauE/SafE family protein [archaeon]